MTACVWLCVCEYTANSSLTLFARMSFALCNVLEACPVSLRYSSAAASLDAAVSAVASTTERHTPNTLLKQTQIYTPVLLPQTYSHINAGDRMSNLVGGLNSPLSSNVLEFVFCCSGCRHFCFLFVTFPFLFL